MRAYLLAQQVNAAAGGAVVAPWEIEQLPEDWLDAATGLTVELADYRKGQGEVDDILEKWRSDHSRGGHAAGSK